jgi:hypothetical protein
MSKPNTMFMDRERDATLEPPISDNPSVAPGAAAHEAERDAEPPRARSASPLPAGLILEIDSVQSALDDAMMAWARRGSDADLAVIEARLDKLISICAHARKTVTALRVHLRSTVKE